MTRKRCAAAAVPFAAAAALVLSACGGSSAQPKVYTSPDAPAYVQPKGRTIQGLNSKTIGTIVVKKRSVLHWASDSPVFQLWDAGQHIRLRTQEHVGHFPIAPGRYRKVSVIAFGRWLITISPT